MVVPSTAVLGGRKRWVCGNSLAFLDHVEHYAPRSDLWVGMRPAHEYDMDAPVYTRLWLEVDAKGDLEYARQKALALRDWAKEVLRVEPYAQFSAGKGFHLHLNHAPVYGRAEQVRTAFRALLGEVGLDPGEDVDMQVAGLLRALPRPPYTLNTGSLENFGQMLFTVPVDLDWTAAEILEASRRVEALPVRIPYAKRAGPILQGAIDDVPAPPPKRELKNGRFLCKEVIVFLERVAPRVTDGRKRFLRHLAVPAYLNVEKSEGGAKEKCREWVERTGAAWSRYSAYVESQVRSSVHYGIRFPMNIRKFIVLNPDVMMSLRSTA